MNPWKTSGREREGQNEKEKRQGKKEPSKRHLVLIKTARVQVWTTRQTPPARDHMRSIIRNHSLACAVIIVVIVIRSHHGVQPYAQLCREWASW